jgi:uncharacterized protein with GYD domain
MAVYMLHAAYTGEGWAQLAKDPQKGTERIAKRLRELGGKLIHLYYCFGEYDTVVIFEAPDEATAAAFPISFAVPGFLKSIKTTSLITIDEAIAAMKKAADAAENNGLD